MAGALDEFGLNRKQMMSGCVEYIKNLKEYFKKRKRQRRRKQLKSTEKGRTVPFRSLPAGIPKGRILKHEKH